MQKTLFKIWNSFFLCFTLFFLCNSFVSAQGIPYAKNGAYLGLTIPFQKLEGDFDGRRVVVDLLNEELIIIPQITSKSGFGVTLGVRGEVMAEELSYYHSHHDASWLSYECDTDINLLNLDTKLYIANEQQIQPYLLLGGVYSWVVVQNGSINSNNYYDNAQLYGFGYNLGGGIALYLNHRLAINGGVTYRYIEFKTMDGVSGEMMELENPIVGSGLSFNVGLTLTIQ